MCKRLLALCLVLCLSLSGCAYHALNNIRVRAKKFSGNFGLNHIEGENVDASIIRTSTMLMDESKRKLKRNPNVEMTHTGDDSTYLIKGIYSN